MRSEELTQAALVGFARSVGSRILRIGRIRADYFGARKGSVNGRRGAAPDSRCRAVANNRSRWSLCGKLENKTS